MKSALLRMCAWALTLAALGLVHDGCAPTPKHVASSQIVGAGSGLDDLRRANVAVYTRATDEMIEAKLSPAAYDAAVAPMNVEFDARVHAIANASDRLYALARELDRTQSASDPAVKDAARDAADALEEAVDVCRDTHALDPVPIPPRVRDQVDRLRALAGQLDAGVDVEVPHG